MKIIKFIILILLYSTISLVLGKFNLKKSKDPNRCKF